MKLNTNFDNLVPNYLFADISKKVAEYQRKNPDAKLIRLGIGDVSLPIAKVVTDAMKNGCEDLAHKETFHGYPDYEGYEFLRESVSKYYADFGARVSADEILISDGAKSDCSEIGDIFGIDNTVLVCDPVYPVYADSNIIAGRQIIYVPATKENGFLAMPDKNVKADIIYLCSPNNPTGSTYSVEQLKEWVDYANALDAVIIYDNAYEAFITDGSPRSIFCLEDAKTCAIEIGSLSKTAGFTGVRCGFTIIPRALKRAGKSIYDLWYRRQSTKFNGVSYPVQCGANAVFTTVGQRQIRRNIAYYQENAKIITDTLDALGIFYTGGKNSPYIWLECPNGYSSREFFDLLLDRARVVTTPGEGFGENGKGFLRITSFGEHAETRAAMERIKSVVSGIK